MLDAIITLLQGDCWTVVGARDGQEALDQLNMGLQPAVVVIDLMLPRVSGWDLLQHLRDTTELRGIPTLVISGFPRENLRVKADVILHKPVDPDRLLSAVRQLVESRRRRPTDLE